MVSVLRTNGTVHTMMVPTLDTYSKVVLTYNSLETQEKVEVYSENMYMKHE